MGDGGEVLVVVGCEGWWGGLLVRGPTVTQLIVALHGKQPRSRSAFEWICVVCRVVVPAHARRQYPMAGIWLQADLCRATDAQKQLGTPMKSTFRRQPGGGPAGEVAGALTGRGGRNHPPAPDGRRGEVLAPPLAGWKWGSGPEARQSVRMVASHDLRWVEACWACVLCGLRQRVARSRGDKIPCAGKRLQNWDQTNWLRIVAALPHTGEACDSVAFGSRCVVFGRVLTEALPWAPVRRASTRLCRFVPGSCAVVAIW